MLSIEQLQLIQRGLRLLMVISPGEELPPIEAVGEAIEAELNYQRASKPLQAEADRLLEKLSPTEVVEQRLAQINAELARLSADRPPEFGGRFSAGDVEAMQIIRAAAKALG
jgi:hypothetical protein